LRAGSREFSDEVTNGRVLVTRGVWLEVNEMNWQIDNAHSHVGFKVRHMMISTVRGEFEEFWGTIDFDEENPEETTVDVTIDAASINTREEDRDNHLRSEDFLYVERYPEITFKSKRVELIDENYATLIGDLTIRGETHEVELDVAYQGMAQSPWGTMSAGFSATTTLNRKDWGLVWNKALETGGFLVGDKLDVEIEVELVKQDAEEAVEEAERAMEEAR
jgi:polyisoprenoid-binding protein YceI